MSNEIGKRISKLLNEKDIKQKELAARVGVSETVISRYIAGSRTPKTEILVNIARELNVSTDYLLGLEKKKIYFVEPSYPFEIVTCEKKKEVSQGTVVQDVANGNIFCIDNSVNIYENLVDAEVEKNRRTYILQEEYEKLMTDNKSILIFVWTHDICKNEIARRAYKKRVKELFGVRFL